MWDPRLFTLSYEEIEEETYNEQLFIPFCPSDHLKKIKMIIY